MLRRLHYLYIAGFLCTVSQLWGQTYPPVAKRDEIVTALNNAITIEPFETNVLVSNVDLLDAVTGDCQDDIPLDLEIVHNWPNYFVLRRKLHSGGTLSGITLTHPLVDNLNYWLNSAWAANLRGIPEIDALGWQCEEDADQRFYTTSSTSSAVAAVVRELTGEARLRSTTYNINGVLTLGSNFMFFEEQSPQVVRYITDLGEGINPDTIRLLSYAFIKFECDEGQVNFAIKFNVETRQYEDGCDYETENSGSFIEIETDGAGVGSSILVTNTCQWPISTSGSVDATNEDIFERYLDKRYKWKYTSNTQAGPTGSGTGVTELGYFSLSPTGYLEFTTWNNDECASGYRKETLCKILKTDYEAEYCETAYCYGGTFQLDSKKRLVYVLPETSECSDQCLTQAVPCIEFCDHAIPEMPEVTGVIAANARTFTDKVSLIENAPIATGLGLYASAGYPHNDFELGTRGKWRSEEEYVYRATAIPGTGLFAGNPNAAQERNYNDAGTFELTLFSWAGGNSPTNWLNTTRVTRYSHNGDPVEEVDIFGIPSAARFGYNYQVPILVAKNATYGSVLFESFEGDIVDVTSSNGEVVSTASHSGKFSYQVPDNNWSDPIQDYFEVDDRAQTDGVLIRMWVKNDYPSSNPTQYDQQCLVKMRLVGAVTYDIASTDFKFVAKTGEWSLFEYELSSPGLGIYSILVQRIDPALTTYVDDIRIQPLRSEMVGYVYDKNNLRQIAMFDDQHFGVFFQYNGEGKLVRKIRETTRGLKTIQETQYHTPEIERAYASPELSSSMLWDSGAGYVGAARAVLGRRSIETEGDDSKFDILDVELGLEKRDVKVFGIPVDRLGEEVERLRNVLKWPSIDSLKIPQIEKLKLLEDLERVDSDLNEFARINDSTMTEAERAAMRKSIQQATEKRAQIMRKLGLSEDEVKNILDQMREIRGAVEEMKAKEKEENKSEPKEHLEHGEGE